MQGGLSTPHVPLLPPCSSVPLPPPMNSYLYSQTAGLHIIAGQGPISISLFCPRDVSLRLLHIWATTQALIKWHQTIDITSETNTFPSTDTALTWGGTPSLILKVHTHTHTHAHIHTHTHFVWSTVVRERVPEWRTQLQVLVGPHTSWGRWFSSPAISQSL